jgi:hypothetical protein
MLVGGNKEVNRASCLAGIVWLAAAKLMGSLFNNTGRGGDYSEGGKEKGDELHAGFCLSIR